MIVYSIPGTSTGTVSEHIYYSIAGGVCLSPFLGALCVARFFEVLTLLASLGGELCDVCFLATRALCETADLSVRLRCGALVGGWT